MARVYRPIFYSLSSPPSSLSTLCSSFAAIPSSLSIIYYFETSKILFHFVAPEKFLGRSRDSRFLLFINGTNRRIFCALWRNMAGGNTMNIQSIDWEIIRGINPLIFDRLEDVFALKVICSKDRRSFSLPDYSVFRETREYYIKKSITRIRNRSTIQNHVTIERTFYPVQ